MSTESRVQIPAMSEDMQMNGNHLYMSAEEATTQITFAG